MARFLRITTFWAILENVLAVVGLLAILALALFGVLNIAERPMADITICDHGKCTQFNVRERREGN